MLRTEDLHLHHGCTRKLRLAAVLRQHVPRQTVSECVEHVGRRKLFSLDALHCTVDARVRGQVSLHVVGQLACLGATLVASKATAGFDAAHLDLNIASLLVELLLDCHRDRVLACAGVRGGRIGVNSRVRTRIDLVGEEPDPLFGRKLLDLAQQ